MDPLPCKLAGPISNLWELFWRRGSGSGSGLGGLGAMAIGAVRWIGASWAMAWPVRMNPEVSKYVRV